LAIEEDASVDVSFVLVQANIVAKELAALERTKIGALL
jgi:hypothetical protein